MVTLTWFHCVAEQKLFCQKLKDDHSKRINLKKTVDISQI